MREGAKKIRKKDIRGWMDGRKDTQGPTFKNIFVGRNHIYII